MRGVLEAEIAERSRHGQVAAHSADLQVPACLLKIGGETCSNERTRDAHENALLLLFVGRLVVLAGKLDAPVTDENTARVAAVANNDVCWRNEGSGGRASAAIRTTRQPANEISISIAW